MLLITLVNALRMPIFSMSFVVDSFQKLLREVRIMYRPWSFTQKSLIVVEREILPSLMVQSNIKMFLLPIVKHPVLSDISFKLLPVRKVALVGESGEGATTLSNLLDEAIRTSKWRDHRGRRRYRSCDAAKS